ncbi:hypothetical protein [Balneola vulgaris]|uniref:hypothetical protein n=1 Tax=Balneola vulgaris TaxID=287535 RepID=UPI00036CA560|nr:hypothetical protein [Balneola vulgaris]
MKILTISLINLLFSSVLVAQSVSLSFSSNSTTKPVAVYESGEVQVKEVSGSLINTVAHTKPSSDPSFKTYGLANGSIIVRENIANFVKYNVLGKTEWAISNSTQSSGGESISELATDPQARTIVLYNPKVKSSGKDGSRAKVVGIGKNDGTTDIYYSADRIIRTVRVAESGEFIAIATGKAGTDDEIVIVDRFGNQIQTITFDQEVKGLNLYGSGSTLTVFSAGRVAVYSVMDGKRIASSSFRNGEVQFANYSSSDQSIIALTGTVEGDLIKEGEVRIVNVAARKIASKEVAGALQFVNLDDITLNRTSRFTYRITGFDKDLRVNAKF